MENLVQIQNPKSKTWVKINRDKGTIEHKEDLDIWEGIKIIHRGGENGQDDEGTIQDI